MCEQHNKRATATIEELSKQKLVCTSMACGHISYVIYIPFIFVLITELSLANHYHLSLRIRFKWKKIHMKQVH